MKEELSATRTQEKSIGEFIVLTYADEGASFWRTYSFPNKERYCARHGYRFVGLKSPWRSDVSPGRSKFEYALKYLGECSWLFWTDADALIMNEDVRLQELIHKKGYFVGASDQNGLSSGQFLVSNCEGGRALLEAVLQRLSLERDRGPQKGKERTALRNVLSERMDDPGVRVLPQAAMNAFPEERLEQIGDKAPVRHYRVGDFIVHYAGQRSHDDAVQLSFEGMSQRTVQDSSSGREWELTEGPLNPATVRRAIREKIGKFSPYPGGYEGRGIVIYGGGIRYFVNAWVCIRVLRKLGCTLPIELWYLGKAEIDERMKSLVEPFGVTCRDAYEVRKTHPCRILEGWELKPYGILHSRFKEVIALDADIVPARDPSYLFDTPEFSRNGAIFWPDISLIEPERPIWDYCEVPYHEGPIFETGQVAIDKKKSWDALNLTVWFNEHSDFFYRYIWGDKDTYLLAFLRLHKSYAITQFQVNIIRSGFLQHDFDGNVLFHHRVMDKWKLNGENIRADDFPNHDFCLEVLAELRTRWKIDPDRIEIGETTGAVKGRVGRAWGWSSG